MTSFDFDISEKDLAGADHVSRVGRKLIAAFVRKARRDGLTKAELARRLDLDKATISRMLRGNANLTLRSVGELCWAIGVHPELQLLDHAPASHRVNHVQVQVMPTAVRARPSAQLLQVSAQ